MNADLPPIPGEHNTVRESDSTWWAAMVRRRRLLRSAAVHHRTRVTPGPQQSGDEAGDGPKLED
eukprot:6529429-Pyramimonas_sp.AAC.1